ncbi:ankyrin repeat-containing domain protein, partial [Sphaerosporella brunnea]
MNFHNRRTTFLHTASEYGFLSCVEMLIQSGINVDVDITNSDFGSALQAASFGGHEAVVRLLLDNKANANSQGGRYQNALMAAATRKHHKIVKMLLDNGANVYYDKREYTHLQKEVIGPDCNTSLIEDMADTALPGCFSGG